ncbi:MAG: Pvc16 family protein [Thermodesulfobacteriota bacterium]
MSVSTAIGLVSESLRNLLLGEMTLTPEVGVTILSPHEQGADRRVNLYLYKVLESPLLKNLDWQARADNPGRLSPPPLSVHLHYLLTPYAINDQQTGNAASHEILGEAMRVLYENPIIPADYLAGELAGAREQIKVMQSPVELEEMSNVWSTFAQPYRLSVAYEVAVVQLDMLSASERTMARRVRQVGVPGVSAPFLPPSVEMVTPMAAPAGAAVTISGKNLAGWRAYVSLMRSPLLAGLELSGDSFSVTIPAGLAPGFYEMRVDISHLSRKTLFFEVTA